LREQIVLGRAGQRGGRVTGELVVELAGAPLLVHTTLLGIGEPLKGAGEEPGLRWAHSVLDGPGWLLLALGDRATDVTQLLDRVAESCLQVGENAMIFVSIWKLSST
jgi:hypothetical protein